jgi:hypothetical protein
VTRRWWVGLTFLVVGCSGATPAPIYRVTGQVRASCFGAAPDLAQTSCAMHAQIQNEGARGSGGRAELTVYYRAAGGRVLVSKSCEDTFPPLDTKDVAELDCAAIGNPPIHSNRVVRTGLTIRPN